VTGSLIGGLPWRRRQPESLAVPPAAAAVVEAVVLLPGHPATPTQQQQHSYEDWNWRTKYCERVSVRLRSEGKME
jgi:hypothetical protein